MLVFYIVFMLTAFGGIFFFGGNKILCILLLAAAVGGGIMRLLPDKRLRKLSVICFPVCLVICLFTGQTAQEGGRGDYKDRLSRAAAQIDKGNMDKGVEILDELDKEFGVTDLSLYARTELFLSLGEYETALSYLRQVQDKSDEYWYEYMEKIYGWQGTDESLYGLETLYLSAAEDLPENSHMQYMAGMVKLGRGATQSAAYYFQRARALDEADPLPCYYLGVISYEQGREDDAAMYFEEALQRGVDEEKKANIRYYGFDEEGGQKE